MSYADAPNSVRSLEQRIRNLEGSEELAIRRRVGMAHVVVGQMLPEGAIKGGSAMALRYGRGTRFTQLPDVDGAVVWGNEFVERTLPAVADACTACQEGCRLAL